MAAQENAVALDDTEERIAKGIAEVMAEADKLPRVAPAFVPEPSLADRFAQLDRIEARIEEKLRHERLDIQTSYTTIRAKLANDFEVRRSTLLAQLDRDHRQALRRLEEETTAKLHDLDQLEKRRG